MLAFLNVFFFVFHTALIVFNLFGWAWKKTRKWNLATLLVTLASWVVVGLWKGFGYCFCTDWHWQVRRAMGITEDSKTYVDLLFRQVGLVLAESTVFWITAGCFVVAFVLSVGLNIRDGFSTRRSRVAEGYQSSPLPPS